jgi:hypothetical protein
MEFKDETDRTCINESGEFTSMVSNLFEGDDLLFTHRVRVELTECWIEILSCELKEIIEKRNEKKGDEPDSTSHHDSARADDINAQLKVGYAS